MKLEEVEIFARQYEEEEKKRNNELVEFNKKFKKEYSQDDFFYKAHLEIKKEDLKGFPALKELRKMGKETYDDYWAEVESWNQLELNFNFSK